MNTEHTIATTPVSQRYRGHDLVLHVGDLREADALTLDISDCRCVSPRQTIRLDESADTCRLRDRLFSLGRLWVDEHPLPWPFAADLRTPA
ncbi:MAG: hypothetical protein ACXU8N_07060 [Telluria sp.]